MGQMFSGGGSRPVTAEELQSVLTMRQELARLPVPTLQHRDNPHEYLYFAFFDGTGQDVNNPGLGPPTNVGALYEQAFGLSTDPASRTTASGSTRMGTSARLFFPTLALLALSACANPGATASTQAPSPSIQEGHAMRLANPPSVVTGGELAPLGDPAIRARMNFQPIEWPLRFKTHQFGARCYDTLTCEVWYDGVPHGDEQPSPPAATYGPNYLEGWSGGHGGILNFPPPAQVKLRSKDGTAHEAVVDIGALFKDERVLHHVPREEVKDVPDGKYDDAPSILLEVNDRTLRVYMRAYVPTRHLQERGNPRSGSRRDLILVQTTTY